jgi:hypothetical protein
MVAMVVAVDQVGKYIAWRGLSSARINVGGDALVGQRVSAWFGEPLKGAVLDAGNFVLLVAAVALLIRARTSRAVAADLFIIVGTPMVIGSLVHQLRRRGASSSAPAVQKAALRCAIRGWRWW